MLGYVDERRKSKFLIPIFGLIPAQEEKGSPKSNKDPFNSNSSTMKECTLQLTIGEIVGHFVVKPTFRVIVMGGIPS